MFDLFNDFVIEFAVTTERRFHGYGRFGFHIANKSVVNKLIEQNKLWKV